MTRTLTEARFRVVVVRKERVRNPDYVQGGDAPYWLYLDETFEEFYGPYDKLGTAKTILTRESLDRNKQPLPWFVSGRIEEAETTWKPVDLGG